MCSQALYWLRLLVIQLWVAFSLEDSSIAASSGSPRVTTQQQRQFGGSAHTLKLAQCLLRARCPYPPALTGALSYPPPTNADRRTMMLDTATKLQLMQLDASSLGLQLPGVSAAGTFRIHRTCRQLSRRLHL